MAIEQGIVIKMGIGSKTAWVKTVRSSACESCSSRDSCSAGAEGKSQEVEAINIAGAQVGDLIQLAVSTGSVMKAMFLLYLFPILCMLAGGAAGNGMAPRMQINPSVMAAIGAMASFVVSLIFVRIWGQRMGRNDAYRPKIIRILGHDIPDQSLEPFTESCANRVENQQ